MSETVHTEKERSPRAPLPPIERDAPGFAPPQQPASSTALGRFLYKHRADTTTPLGHMGYQLVRNVAAAIPYGIATVGVWQGFETIAKRTAEKPVGSFGHTVNKLARSPVRDIAMIAVGFTLYRGTLRFVRYMKERLLNPEYTPEQAEHAAKHIGATAWDTAKEIVPAEINSTPYGAIALGLGRRYLDGIADFQGRAPADKIATTKLGGTGAQERMLRFTKEGKFHPHLTDTKSFFNKIAGKGSRVWTEAGVLTLSFLAFFELSDRLFKDVQVRRGLWYGEHNSIARTTPENAAKVFAQHPGSPDPVSHSGNHKEVLGVSDPNLLRMGFTRVLPTVLGIGAYTFTKRASYAAMGHFTGKDTFWKRAFVEGAATATFFVMTSATDIVEGIWRKHFEPKQQMNLNPHQEKNYGELLERINAREQGAQRVA